MSVVSGYFGAKAAKKGARSAAASQEEAARLGIEESRAQFDTMQGLMNPYAEAGTGALEQQQAIAGLLGPEAQQQAIQGIENDPYTQQMIQQGEEGILANASATGGLRGGDTQGFLAQYRPQMINQRIQDQYSRLGGLSNMGYNASSTMGQGAMNLGQQVSGLYGDQGAAQAGSALAIGKANQGMWNNVGQLGTDIATMGAGGGAFGAGIQKYMQGKA